MLAHHDGHGVPRLKHQYFATLVWAHWINSSATEFTYALDENGRAQNQKCPICGNAHKGSNEEIPIKWIGIISKILLWKTNMNSIFCS